ncbi:MAG: DUF115 domain-containing protein [Myxococcota bacterium]|nr:DUF115 domain-containing protein [Myxococcota bacterium]
MAFNPRSNLGKNLPRLRRKDADLARRVEEAGDDGFELITSRNGTTTVAVKGIQLASAYDPRREAARVVDEVLEEKPDLIVSIGFGLGHHIEAIRERSAAPVIIYEPCEARMRGALCARSALTLFGDRQIDVASTPDWLFHRLEARYLPGLRVQVYIHPPLLELAPDTVREAVSQISRAKDYVDISVGTRVRDLKVWSGVTMQNAGLIMQNPSVKELFGKFQGVPAVVVSAGPSLDKQLDTLARYRDRVLVICIGQALGALRTAGIEPDLVHVLESQDVAHQLSRVGTSDNVNLVVTNDVAPSLFEVPVRSRFVATPGGDKVGRWIASSLDREGWVFGGSTVAHGAVSLACALGANPIMLIGQDLAYTDGRHYAKGSAYDDVEIEFSEDGYTEIDSRGRAERLGGLETYVPRRNRVVWVDGWHGEQVPTSPAYAGFIDGYRALGVGCALHGSEVVNCTEGGARIEGLGHLAFEEALERCAVDSIDAGSLITEAYDAYEAPDARAFSSSISRSRRILNKLDATASKGIKRCRETLRELPRAHAPQRKIDLLKRLGRTEKDVQTLLLEMPWIDAVVQPEVNASSAEIRRDGSLEATPEQAIKEARFLFEATQKGVDRATRLLTFCAESVAGKRDFSQDHEPEVQAERDAAMQLSGGQAPG